MYLLDGFTKDCEEYKAHLKFLKIPDFEINCSQAIFSNEELDVLKMRGYWYKALTDGVIKPITRHQITFVKVAQGEKKPFSPDEWAWFKYLGRKKLENEMGDKLKAQYTIDENQFFNREM